MCLCAYVYDGGRRKKGRREGRRDGRGRGRERERKVQEGFHWGNRPVFNLELELELVNRIQKLERALFGLTTLEICKFAFEFAERAKIKHQFQTNSKMELTAGSDCVDYLPDIQY